MATAPNPLQSANMPPMPGNPNSPPDALSIDKQRVSLILEINSYLLEQIQALQAEGKGGDVQSPQAANSSADGSTEQQKKPSREYVEPLRRMQANLAYLASLAERHQKPNANHPPWPQVMTPPPGDEKLAGMYARLQGLFPMWKAHQQRMAAAAQAQQANMGAQQNIAGMVPQHQAASMGGMGRNVGGGS